MRALLLLTACCAPIIAEPIHTYDFEAEDAATGWNHRTLPAIAFGSVEGVHGFYRAPKGSSRGRGSQLLPGGARATQRQ